jgi:Xaa-Pro aminopeptidase
MRTDHRDDRRAALLRVLEERELDGLLVTHLPNVRYLSGFTGTAGVAVVLRQETIVVTDFRYRAQAHEEINDHARIEIAPSDVWERVGSLMGEYAGVEVLGFESHACTVKQAERIAELMKPLLEPVADVVEGLRVQKDPSEVRAIRAAADIALDAYAATLEHVRVGQREIDVAAELERALRERGSEWHPFPTIVASGPRAALPHAGASTRVIGCGDWLLLDFGAQVDGYCADITRTVVVGAPADDRQRTVYELVREAQIAARTNIRAGMIACDVDRLARSLIEARGFGDAFGHSLGHGLGLEVHEAPRVSRTSAEPLPSGAVVTIEPGVYVPGWGGVRLEDDVFLGPDGSELLSDGQIELRELR